MPQEISVAPQISLASTLPSCFYTDPGIYRKSIENIFVPSWQFIGDSSQAKVPGAVYPFTLLEGSVDEPLVLTRDLNDKLHLLSNVCTHRANLVCEGPGNERFLRCRYHGRRFGLDGKFQSMPEFEGVDGFPSPKEDLPELDLKSWGPLLFASIRPSASFEKVFEHIFARLTWLPIEEFRFDPSRSKDYLVRGHWALYVDNYLEAFHIPFIHPGLNQALVYETYSYELFDHGNLQIGPASDAVLAFDVPESSPDYGQRIAAYYYWLFPNTMLNFYPWGLSINVVKPLGLELTRVSFLCYVWREELVEQGAGAALDRTEREDETVVELVQKGVKSRFYDRGRFSPKREIGTHHFHRLAAQALSM